jgi:hypothetical protein
MKLKFEVIPVKELESGDIFYCTPNPDMNEFGEDHVLTGTDQIFIKDDYYEEDDDDNYAILVNGGWHIWFKPHEKVVRLGRYNDLVRVIEMVQEGNPEMELGPNDILTKADALRDSDPELYDARIAGLQIDLDLDQLKRIDEEDEEDDYNPDENELPF